jgi:transposase
MAMGAQERLVEIEAVVVGAAAGERSGVDKAFRPYDPDQVLLMAPVLRDWVPEGDLAHFVADLVDSGVLDLSAIYDDYTEERGYPPYDPRLMVKLLLYGYAVAVTSSRKLERATYRDVAVRMLCADQHPDYRSIARFRERHLQALADLFVQALRLCRQARLVGLGVLAIDGTKLRANASRHKAMSYERMLDRESELETEIAALREQVDTLLADAQATDEAEDAEFGADRRGDELPAELQRRETRLARIREAKQALEEQARAAEQARRAEMAEQGKQPRNPAGGRDPFTPKPKAQRNFTDPDSKIMKTADGSFHQCYNGQIVVDSVTQVIVACDAFDAAPDAQLLEPLLDQLADNLTAIDASLPDRAALLGDAGYLSEHNVLITEAHSLDPHLAAGRLKHTDPPPLTPSEPVPEDATARQRMLEKLATATGAALYARRKTIVEPVFGQMQTVQDARQLRLRGRPAARAQHRFQCAVHNLLKLHRNGGLALILTG